MFILIRKIAPEIVVRPQSAQCFEHESYDPPGAKCFVVVTRIIDMNLNSRAKLACVLMKSRLEPALTQTTAAQPCRRERFHLCQQFARFQIGRAEKFQW